MEIRRVADGMRYTLSFVDHELLLVSDMIGNSFSGSANWAVPDHAYENVFGISVERARQIFESARKQWKEQRSAEPIELDAKELRAIKIIFEHMLEKWDENDFQTIANAKKIEAMAISNTLAREIAP